MNHKKIIFIIKGEIKDEVVSYKYDHETNRIWITYQSGKSYPYVYANVKILSDPTLIDHEKYLFYRINGIVFNNIKEVYEFTDGFTRYYRLFFENGSFKSYKESELAITENLINEKKTGGLFEYYKEAAHYSDLKTDEGTVILGSIYDKIQYIDPRSVLADYLKGEIGNENYFTVNAVFPFGCNLSQITAVENALTNKISIIEGPPGTGKTQTILNIIANAVMSGKTVLVVSNNNSATDNVFEKLQKNGYDFFAAQMGSRKKQCDFIANKQTKYPDFSQYPRVNNTYSLNLALKETTDRIKTLFKKKNRLAELQNMLPELKLEEKYFLDYFSSNIDEKRVFKKDKFTSGGLLDLWAELLYMKEIDSRPGLFKRLKYRYIYGFVNTDTLFSEVEIIVAHIKKMYYEHKIKELENEINALILDLKSQDMEALANKLTEESLQLFNSKLYELFNNGVPRKIFDKNYWKDPGAFLSEYPVLLSTTFSSRSCFKNMMYDYVIVDEASQVDLTCGVLAMSCAKNIVIVGDLKQLPNVIPSKDKEKLVPLSDSNNIPQRYRCEEQSLLSSACEVFTDAPRALLREHYRCHPKIINFCNKKFYNDQLIIMTEDNGDSDVLKAYITPPGNHARGRYNQRQIDVITKEILPELDSDDVGIIAPYNDQTSALAKEVTDQIPISTVHKFQGREKDDIIISTVDNEITEFTDDPNMLNVAVSRAKNRLRIVVSDNENNKNTNIGELVRYIEYNNFDVHKSELYSVFDMLYKGFEAKRREFLKTHKIVSKYDSENLMYALIEDVLKDNRFSKLDVVSHLPLNNIIRDYHLLDDEEVNYVTNPLTHIDFVIYGKVDKSLLLAVEVDGFDYHKDGTRQHERDKMKNRILEKYHIPVIRFSTVGSGEREKLINTLIGLLGT